MQSAWLLVPRLYQAFLRETVQPITWDAGAHLTIGRGLLHGLRMYQDLFDFRPPGIMVIAAFIFGITRDPDFLGAVTWIAMAAATATPLMLTYALRRSAFPCWPLAAAVFGLLCALYVEDRANYFQSEAPAIAFSLLFLISLRWSVSSWSGGRWINRTDILRGLLVLGAVGCKEPFLVTVCAIAVIEARSWGEFKAFFIRPSVVAVVLGSALLLLLGSFQVFFTEYLYSLFSLLYSGLPGRGSALMKTVTLADFNATTPMFLKDLQNRLPWVISTILLTLCCAFLRELISGGPLARRAILAARFLLVPALIVVAIQSGVVTYFHHFTIAIPIYIALFGQNRQKIPGIWRQRLVAVEGFGCALLVILAARSTPIFPKASQMDNVRALRMEAEQNAARLDELLTLCDIPDYLFLGAIGPKPFLPALTNHSPRGPVFFQLPHFIDGQLPSLREKFLHQLRTAQIVVLDRENVPWQSTDMQINETILTTIEPLIEDSFSKALPVCAATAPPLSQRYDLYFRSQ